MSRVKWGRSLLVLGSLFFIVGCGGQDGPVRFKLSGNVNMPDGKPVPAGELNLEPDSKAGNKGPATMTTIKDGKYSLSADQGILGGSYNVTILAFDGVPFGESEMGKPLSKQPHVETVDFPKENSTRDFKILIKK